MPSSQTVPYARKAAAAFRPPAYRRSLHLYAVFLSCATLALLFIGGMVTSTDSGLSVPDWPTTYNHNMFTFPPSMMVGGIFYEHGHRLVASLVGLLTIGLWLALLRWDHRPWLRWLGFAALILVVAQGVLGGLTVLYRLPMPVSAAHAVTAEVFFLLTLWAAFATSRTWLEGGSPSGSRRGMSGLAAVMCLAVFLQVLAGAVIRHSYAGLAIPTFPSSFGHWLPPFWNTGITLHFLHSRVGAAALAVLGGVLGARLAFSRSHRAWPRLLGGSLPALLCVQIALGAFTVWSGRPPVLASLHLAAGALIFGISFLILLATLRFRTD